MINLLDLVTLLQLDTDPSPIKISFISSIWPTLLQRINGAVSLELILLPRLLIIRYSPGTSFSVRVTIIFRETKIFKFWYSTFKEDQSKLQLLEDQLQDQATMKWSFLMLNLMLLTVLINLILSHRKLKLYNL